MARINGFAFVTIDKEEPEIVSSFVIRDVKHNSPAPEYRIPKSNLQFIWARGDDPETYAW
ncbi:MAG: hypothetical protein CXX81_21075 [Methanobacteriota archaeon]|nr:MAG: hypothetical protein CXX81_26115 [Euryarchaeota archaeon]PXY74551.1 MAG: hypothetical protein CXX81_21075 [Euryarchaeota archaeon]